MRSTGGLSQTTTQTPPAPAGTLGTPLRGGLLSGGTDGQARTPGQPQGRGRGAGGGGGGWGLKEEGAGQRRGSGAAEGTGGGATFCSVIIMNE